jgi:hypothetical protein
MTVYRRASSIVAVAAVILGACAPTRFVYAPVSTTSGEVEGAPAVVYDLPPGAARGDVRVAMLGIALLQPLGVEDSTLRAIHVAMEVRNRSDELWTIDPAEAHLVLATDRTRSEIYATSAQIHPMPRIDVAPRSQAAIHLYFPLPLHLQTERSLPGFDVIWSIRTGSRAVTERTGFQRFIASPPVDPAAGRYPHEL